MPQSFKSQRVELGAVSRLIGPFNAYPNYPWHIHLLVISPILLMVIFVGIFQSFWGEPARIHYEELRDVFPGVTRFMSIISDYTVEIVSLIYFFIIIHSFVKEDRSSCMFILRYVVGILIFAAVITTLLKVGLGFPRPDFPCPAIPFNGSHAYSSFPSGHTVNIIIASLPLMLWLRNKFMSVGLTLLIVLVGFSRIWLGEHHPVDVLGGIILASIAVRFIACSPGYLASLTSETKCL